MITLSQLLKTIKNYFMVSNFVALKTNPSHLTNRLRECVWC